MTVYRRGRCFPYVARESPIWMASSLVGVSTRHRILLGQWPWWAWEASPFGAGCFELCRRSSIGREKAAVFPVPVWAQPTISRPERMMGIDCAWIGVGTVYPSVESARRIGSESPSSVKRAKMGGGERIGRILGNFSKKAKNYSSSK
jgi:hypothetical protein